MPEYKRYLQLVIRRKELFVVVALLVMTAAFVGSYLLPTTYESSGTLAVERNLVGELVKGITVSPPMEDTINVLTYAITSRPLIAKAVAALKMKPEEGSTEDFIKKVQEKTTVKIKERNLFTISFTDNNPRLARDYVNTLLRLYIQERTSSNRGESYDATQFLSQQMAAFYKKLERAENAVNAYKREQGGLISIDEASLFEQINDTQQRLYDLQLRRRQLEGMRRATRRSSTMQGKLSDLQKKLDDLRTQYTDNYPDVISVRTEMESVREQMQRQDGEAAEGLPLQEVARIESEIEAIKVTEEGLRRLLASNRDMLRRIPSAKAGLEKLELEKKNQKDLYDQLVARHGQSEVSKQMEVEEKSITFRIVDPAQLPTRPSGPNRLRIMLLGMVGAVAVSFGGLILLDLVDNSVKGVEEVRELGLPVLAVVPRVKDPALAARQRTTSRAIFATAGVCFAFLILFPAMEIMGLPYMAQMMHHIVGKR